MIISDLLKLEMEVPNPYGSFLESWFHYLAIIVVVIMTIWLTKLVKKSDDIKLNKILLVFSLVLITFEIYKQVLFTYEAKAYQWYAFPFQFCSVPMYVSLLASFVKNKKVKNALLMFLATFSLFAGLAVIIYPGDVFTASVGINIQTMVHHGGMVALGMALLINNIKKYNIKNFLSGTLVFLSIIIIASFLNYIHNEYIGVGTFNMFFINPKFSNHLPILSNIQPKVSPFLFILIYTFGFSGIAMLIYSIRIMFSYKKEVSFQVSK